jgi:hypothetical protein
MSRLSQREAARQWAVGRATLQRAIRAGKLTPDNAGLIDPADLLRVFGEPGASRIIGPPKTTLEPPGSEVEIVRLRAELEAARALLAEKDAVISAKNETIAAMRLLTYNPPPSMTPQKRRWWQRK